LLEIQTMLTFEQIKELAELVARYRLQSLEIDRSGFQLKIQGEAATPAAPAVVVAPAAAAAPQLGSEVRPASGAPPAAAPTPTPEPARAADLHVVTSPIVGTFYAAPSPDADPFVRPGDRVRKGQVLCIVEAMKLMNEIECDIDGVVAEIYPKNAQPIEYGEPLFGVRAD